MLNVETPVAEEQSCVSRRAGTYAAIVEHESRETFMVMQNSPEHTETGKRVEPPFDGHPPPHFYELVVK